MNTKRILYLFLIVCSISASSVASEFDELVEDVDPSLIRGNTLIEHEFGYAIDKPNEKWAWRIAKSPISKRDYILVNEENNNTYIIMFNSDVSPLTQNSPKEIIEGAKREAAEQGFTLSDASYEFTDILTKGSFLVSVTAASSGGNIQSDWNMHVVVVDGQYISIMQYISESFDKDQLINLVKNIRRIESTSKFLADEKSYYNRLGRWAANVFIWGGVFILIILVFKSIIKSKNRSRSKKLTRP